MAALAVDGHLAPVAPGTSESPVTELRPSSVAGNNVTTRAFEP